MEYYIDVRLNPDAEMRENVLLNKVYTKFHKALSSLQATDIGVSFPCYKLKLGKLLRIHSTESRLLALQKMGWLGGLSGYCDVSECKMIPEHVKHRIVSRKQSNMTEAKLRRLIRRGSISQKEIRQYKAKMFSQSIESPYLELTSTSNGHSHRRFVQFSDIYETQKLGKFDLFGFSKEATIPWF